MSELWIRPPASPTALALPVGVERRWSDAERDQVLLGAMRQLEGRVAPSAWTRSSVPFSDLDQECARLSAAEPLGTSVREHLSARPAPAEAAEMLFTMIAMSARARWQDAPAEHRPTAARGWFLGRWIPTFLVLDGPIGRFLERSPLAHTADAPLLAGARQLLRERSFLALRNGFAHWAFRWEAVGGESFVVARGDRGAPEVRLSQAEADAFHILAFALVQILYDRFMASGRRDPSGAPRGTGSVAG